MVRKSVGFKQFIRFSNTIVSYVTSKHNVNLPKNVV